MVGFGSDSMLYEHPLHWMHRLFLNIRGPGGYIGVHSGNPTFSGRGWGVKASGDKPAGVTSPPDIEWSVGCELLSLIMSQCNFGSACKTNMHQYVSSWLHSYMSIIVALEDIGPGDGPTVLVPGRFVSFLSNCSY